MTSPATAPTTSRLRLFLAACSGMFCFGIVLALLGALFGLPAFRERLGINLVQQGSILSLLYLGVLVATPLAGPVIDRFGNKLVMLVSALLVTAALAGFVVVRSFTGAAVAGIVLGLGGGGLNIATNSLVSDVYVERRGPMLNYLGMFYGFGALFIPLLAATISGRFSPAQIVLFGLALSVACAFGYGMLSFPAPRAFHGFVLKDAARVAADPGVLLLACLLFFQMGDEAVITGWTSTYAGSLGASSHAATWVLATYWGALMLGRIFAAQVLRLIGKSQVLLGSALASLAAYGAFLVSHNLVAMLAGSAFLGLSFAAIIPTTLALVGDRYQRFSASVFSFVFTVALLAGMLMPWLTGQLAARHGLHAGMLLPLVGRIAVVILLLAIRSRERQLPTADVRG